MATFLAALAVMAWVPPARAVWSNDPLVNGPVFTGSQTENPHYDIAYGNDGYFVAWCDNENGATTGMDCHVQRHDLNGVPRWGAGGVTVCNAAGDQEEPRVAAAPDGGVVVGWTDGRGADTDVYAQKFDASGTPQWTANGVAVISTGADNACSGLVSDGLGGALAVDGSAGLAARIDSAGSKPWAGDVQFTAAGHTPHDGLVRPASGGAVIILWGEYSSPTYTFYAQRITRTGNKTWHSGTPVPLASTTQPLWAIEPRDAVDDLSGGAFFLWTDVANAATGGLKAQKVNSLGVLQLWPSLGANTLTLTTGYPSYGSLAAGPSGGAYLCWFEPANDKLYVTSRANSGADNWSETKEYAVSGGPRAGGDSQALPDGENGVIVVWNPLHRQVLAQRVDPAGEALWADNAQAVSTAIFPPGSGLQAGEASWKYLPAAASDGSGSVVAVWRDNRNHTPGNFVAGYEDPYFDIYIQNVTAGGALGWRSTLPGLMGIILRD